MHKLPVVRSVIGNSTDFFSSFMFTPKNAYLQNTTKVYVNAVSTGIAVVFIDLLTPLNDLLFVQVTVCTGLHCSAFFKHVYK